MPSAPSHPVPVRTHRRHAVLSKKLNSSRYLSLETAFMRMRPGVPAHCHAERTFTIRSNDILPHWRGATGKLAGWLVL